MDNISKSARIHKQMYNKKCNLVDSICESASKFDREQTDIDAIDSFFLTTIDKDVLFEIINRLSHSRGPIADVLFWTYGTITKNQSLLNLRSDREFAKRIIKISPRSILSMPKPLKEDKEIVMSHIKYRKDIVFQIIPSRLINDPDIISLVIDTQTDPWIIAEMKASGVEKSTFETAQVKRSLKKKLFNTNIIDNVFRE